MFACINNCSDVKNIFHVFIFFDKGFTHFIFVFAEFLLQTDSFETSIC